jgi:hypothetical protein
MNQKLAAQLTNQEHGFFSELVGQMLSCKVTTILTTIYSRTNSRRFLRP